MNHLYQSARAYCVALLDELGRTASQEPAIYRYIVVAVGIGLATAAFATGILNLATGEPTIILWLAGVCSLFVLAFLPLWSVHRYQRRYSKKWTLQTFVNTITITIQQNDTRYDIKFNFSRILSSLGYPHETAGHHICGSLLSLVYLWMASCRYCSYHWRPNMCLAKHHLVRLWSRILGHYVNWVSWLISINIFNTL